VTVLFCFFWYQVSCWLSRSTDRSRWIIIHIHLPIILAGRCWWFSKMIYKVFMIMGRRLCRVLCRYIILSNIAWHVLLYVDIPSKISSFQANLVHAGRHIQFNIFRNSVIFLAVFNIHLASLHSIFVKLVLFYVIKASLNELISIINHSAWQIESIVDLNLLTTILSWT